MQTAVKSRMRGWYRTMASMVKVSARPGLRQTEDVLAPDTCPIFHLEGFSDVPVLQPGLSFYLDLLRRHQGFAFVKRTHFCLLGWFLLILRCRSGDRAHVNRGETVKAPLVRELFNDDAVVKAVDQRSGYTSPATSTTISTFRSWWKIPQLPLAMRSYVEATSFLRLPKLRPECPALQPVESGPGRCTIRSTPAAG